MNDAYKRPVVDDYDTTTKWRSWRINRKFLRYLQQRYPHGFTYRDAYRWYAAYHWRGRTAATSAVRMAVQQNLSPTIIEYLQRVQFFGDNWMQMNVRNHICAAIYRGLPIKRVGKGKFVWTGDLP